MKKWNNLLFIFLFLMGSFPGFLLAKVSSRENWIATVGILSPDTLNFTNENANANAFWHPSGIFAHVFKDGRDEFNTATLQFKLSLVEEGFYLKNLNRRIQELEAKNIALENEIKTIRKLIGYENRQE